MLLALVKFLPASITYNLILVWYNPCIYYHMMYSIMCTNNRTFAAIWVYIIPFESTISLQFLKISIILRIYIRLWQNFIDEKVFQGLLFHNKIFNLIMVTHKIWPTIMWSWIALAGRIILYTLYCHLKGSAGPFLRI